MSKIWLITGANRGFGWEIAKNALDAGDSVVVSSRKGTLPDDVDASNQLLPLRLDVTDQPSIDDAVAAAVERFGRIDVLVNNAGYGQLGSFEELSPESIDRQFATNVFGVFNVTRAVLPVMRRQHSGHIITISSIAGISTGAGSTIYGATKFAVTGWTEGLDEEVAPFGIHTTTIHPGMFRTDFLDPSSVSHADIELDDYADQRQQRREYLDSMNHQQLGDPEKFGPAVVKLAALEHPPIRWGAGSDAYDAYTNRADALRSSAQEWEQLTRSTDITD